MLGGRAQSPTKAIGKRVVAPIFSSDTVREVLNYSSAVAVPAPRTAARAVTSAGARHLSPPRTLLDLVGGAGAPMMTATGSRVGRAHRGTGDSNPASLSPHGRDATRAGRASPRLPASTAGELLAGRADNVPLLAGGRRVTALSGHTTLVLG